jgi:transposase
MGAAEPLQVEPTARREPVLVAAREFLEQGRHEQVLQIIRQLLSRNADLESRRAGTQKNEAVGRAQLLLLVQGAEESRPEAEPETVKAADQKLRTASGIDDEPMPKPKLPRTRPTRQGFPASLRRVKNPLRVPADQRACPLCGTDRVCIGHDLTETLELLPAELIVRQDLQEKLACRPCESEVVRAPPGDKLIEGGRLGITIGVRIVVDKYRDGLPLHRQAERFARLGWSVSRSTLCDQVAHVAELLQPLHRVAQRETLAADVMHLDATQLKVRDPEHPKVIYPGSLWGYLGRSGPLTVAFLLLAATGKKVGQKVGELGPEEILARRVGPTVADASNTFDASFGRSDLPECGCNMHSRRCFCRALDAGDVRASLPLAAYKKLYAIEKEIRGREPDAIREERRRRSKPVFDELVAWCQVRKPHEPPQTPLGKAIRYQLNHQVALGRFLNDGRLPIDNGAMERQFIRVALARNAFLFAGSEEGARSAAILFTMLACCDLAEVNPEEYLLDVLPKLTRGIREVDAHLLLPNRWKEARAAAANPTASR